MTWCCLLHVASLALSVAAATVSSLPALPLSPPALPPPRVLLSSSRGTTELIVPVAPGLDVTLLEASMEVQDGLVREALDPSTPAGAAEDPYGVVLWPAAQVVASAVAARPIDRALRWTLLELGAGTGLCSLAAAARGAAAVATDYREEPLRLLRSSAQTTAERLGRPLALTTLRFDITDFTAALPHIEGPLIVCAADLLYLRSTSVALARRCAEALRRPNVEAVYVGDLGRPGRAAFLEELSLQGVRSKSAVFRPVAGWSAPAPRNELISSSPACGVSDAEIGTVGRDVPAGFLGGRQPRCAREVVSVGLLRLERADLTSY